MSSYSDVKNYIHNELGISKEYVEEIILKIVKEEINKLFTDEERLQVILERIIKQTIRKDEHKILYHLLINFDSLIYKKITETLFKEVKSKIKIQLIDEKE